MKYSTLLTLLLAYSLSLCASEEFLQLSESDLESGSESSSEHGEQYSAENLAGLAQAGLNTVSSSTSTSAHKGLTNEEKAIAKIQFSLITSGLVEKSTEDELIEIVQEGLNERGNILKEKGSTSRAKKIKKREISNKEKELSDLKDEEEELEVDYRKLMKDMKKVNHAIIRAVPKISENKLDEITQITVEELKAEYVEEIKKDTPFVSWFNYYYCTIM